MPNIDLIIQIFAIVVAVLLGALLIWLFLSIVLRRIIDNSQQWKLFNTLSSTHALTRKERKLLRTVVEVSQLAQPAEIFVRPVFFQDFFARNQHITDYQLQQRIIQKIYS